MTLREFLDAAYVIQVREATRMGVPLLDVLTRMEGQAQRKVGAVGRAARRVAPVEAGNEAAFAQLQRMMAGVKIG